MTDRTEANASSIEETAIKTLRQRVGTIARACENLAFAESQIQPNNDTSGDSSSNSVINAGGTPTSPDSTYDSPVATRKLKQA